MRQQSDAVYEPAQEMQRLSDVASRAFDVVFEYSQVMMCAVDHHFRIAKVNRRWTERMGFQSREVLARIPHLAQTSDAVNRQLSCFSSRYMNLIAVFQI